MVDALLNKEGSFDGWADADDPHVFIKPTKGACDECLRDYLDDQGVPKVWLLSQLLANGTNIGVPKKNRKPVIPPHHPWCLCQLNRMPPGHSFDTKGELIFDNPKEFYQKLLRGEKV